MYSAIGVWFVLFFFHAEDGIRDYDVTGVQTCALPIFKKLGLNPDSMIRNADRGAMGGPLEKLTTGAGDTIDPRFERLGLSIARMDALERGLDRVPSVAPHNVQIVTSSYGYPPAPVAGAAPSHWELKV